MAAEVSVGTARVEERRVVRAAMVKRSFMVAGSWSLMGRAQDLVDVLYFCIRTLVGLRLLLEDLMEN